MVAELGNLAALRNFLLFLASVRGDLANITAPPFILAPQSLVEFPSYWAERPALFTAAARETQPERRLLQVLKLYIASLQRQYYVGRTVKEGLKKPLNPFLGEVFFGEYHDPAGKGRVKVISEQVSHHPPTTACYLSDDDNGVHAEAFSTQSTTLSGTSVLIRQSGHALLTVDKYDETYLMPLPDVWAKGVLSGVPYPELNGTYKIISSSGFTAEMSFSGKRLFGGNRNGFEASIYRTKDPTKKPEFELRGSWSDSFTIRGSKGDVLEKYEVSAPKNAPVPISLPSLAEQSPWESRRAWAPVIHALRKGDVSGVLAEKSQLENAQREMRKKEKVNGEVWETAFFSRCEEHELGHVFESVTSQLGDLEIDGLIGSDGCWRFSPEKRRKWVAGDGPRRAQTPRG